MTDRTFHEAWILKLMRSGESGSTVLRLANLIESSKPDRVSSAVTSLERQGLVKTAYRGQAGGGGLMRRVYGVKV